METTHRIFYKDSRRLKEIDPESIHLVVTSPPYPMISMWDDVFIKMNSKIGKALEKGDGDSAFKFMHAELRKTWEAIFEKLIPGGHLCINIGDATRTINDQFKLYSNHSEIITQLCDIGYIIFPEIIWRKPSNSPTKFLGSGMLPCGAYVTLEHEHILIFRKPKKREFKEESEKQNRRESSIFWEERNNWFSDLWYLNGTRQDLNEKKIRKRSAAFPIEIPLRLINMFSSKHDVVFDPFLGTATTTLASIICCRNSIGYEIDKGFSIVHKREIQSSDFKSLANKIIKKRIRNHIDFMTEYKENGGEPKYKNSIYGFPVVTRQEVEIRFEKVEEVNLTTKQDEYEITYSDMMEVA